MNFKVFRVKERNIMTNQVKVIGMGLFIWQFRFNMLFLVFGNGINSLLGLLIEFQVYIWNLFGILQRKEFEGLGKWKYQNKFIISKICFVIFQLYFLGGFKGFIIY